MATFSRHGYERVAEVLNEALDFAKDLRTVGNALDVNTTEAITRAMANMFEEEGGNFDRQRFYQDVGLSEIEESGNETHTDN